MRARCSIRIQILFCARENVVNVTAAGPNQSEIGGVLSELDDFVVAGINRKKGFRLLSRMYPLSDTLIR